MLARGRKGCGFAVGREPLASFFAACGTVILATDLPIQLDTTNTLSACDWATTGQHSELLECLHHPVLIDIAESTADNGSNLSICVI